jgi:phosphoglycolate phosphatase
VGADLSNTAVIFDLDGTLIDTAEDLSAAMNHALQCVGLPPVPMKSVRSLVGHGARAMLRRAFAEVRAPAPDEAALDTHVAAFLDYYTRHIAVASRPFPHVLEALDALEAAGARIALCTNKREAPARQLLSELGLIARFAAIVGMDTTEAAKPDPRPVVHCLRLAGVSAGVFIGDSDTDIEAATRAGLPCLVSTLGYGPILKAGAATHLFGDYRVLPRLVRRVVQTARTIPPG